ncbi:NDP-hexose 2,3-dehydratase family protein [Streptomyces sp. P38-E01]|uniref:NDP-hexose 2,3-dehydratase family protein n=1 Tax=Streptomyces tardus TaxID=2780544 RepID=A0A949NAM7_9ACTN|nr:NDP-hexose 2,3-dehydratase family protein [Streptomyces tardus]MBU7600846.1 NDP-hexose 2,3-dehydratase family protein [Streptomyces tardus]
MTLRHSPPPAEPDAPPHGTSPVAVLEGGAATLRPRHHRELAARLALSAATTEGAHMRTEDVQPWLEERRAAGDFHVDRIAFDELDQWRFEETTGNVVHRSGRFFTVEGMDVVERDGPYGDGPSRRWQQPVIRQPEVGILGILAKEFDGVLHFLMQAKMEPGNPNVLQLSPTVQATRSNYTRAHRGTDVKLIDHFFQPDPDRVVVDVLQSEQGSWFYRKTNRNMCVETVEEVEVPEDYCWLTLGQIADLLHADETVNMNARTVLSCLPTEDPDGRALHSDTQLLSWFTGERSRHDIQVRRLPLASVEGWKQGAETIEHEEGRYFRVVAVAVRGSNRERVSWTQPLIEPVGLGVTAFLTREIAGVRHVLVRAVAEGGFLDTVEFAPTVQATPGNHAHLPAADQPLFLDHVLDAPDSRVLYRAVHSEEGGRFLNARSRYLVVDAGEHPAALDPPPGFLWATPAQLSTLTGHGHYVNVEARTLLACLHAMAAGTRGRK